VTREKQPARAARRGRDRAGGKLVRDLERLAQLDAGGSAERPIEVASPAQVEVMALHRACPLCSGPLRLEEHAAATVDGARLRIARVVCTACSVRRALFFRLAEEQPLH
jgi:hypothetical protein